MAELTKLKTGSVGSQGETIFDVFAGEEHIKDPSDVRLKGIDIASLPDRPQAPIGFTSQFQPVELKVADKIPAEVLEDKTTKTDIQTKLEANLVKQEAAREKLIELAKPTKEETDFTNDIEALNEMLRQGIQQVEERALGGAVLKSGIASEINNIVQGNTRESLVILRNIDTKTRLLGIEQRKRQQEIEVEKLKLDRDIASEDSLFKIDKLNRDMRKDAEAKEDRLTSRQKTYLDNITSSFVGLTYDELTPEQQRTVAQQSNQIDPTGTLLAGIRNKMNVEKNELELKNLKAKADIARTKQLTEEDGKKVPQDIVARNLKSVGLDTSIITTENKLTKERKDKIVSVGVPPSVVDLITQAIIEGSTLEDMRQALKTSFGQEVGFGYLDKYMGTLQEEGGGNPFK